MGDDNVKSLNILKRAWRDRSLVLFLGAGVSASRGLPTWDTLAVDLVATNASKLSDFWPNYRRAASAWMAETLDLTPVALSRIFKMSINDGAKWRSSDQQKYLTKIQSTLYPANAAAPSPSDRDTLSGVADLIARSEGAGRHIPAVITTNFDDLLERELKRRGVRPHVVYNETPSPRNGALEILHVHGYIPSKPAAVPMQEIVFAEDEYHELTYNMFHWAIVELVHLLRTSTVLFVGFSMTDPNIRRLLDATGGSKKSLKHVAVKKRLDFDAAQLDTATEDIAKRAAALDAQARKQARGVAEVVQAAVRQTRRYDQQMLERLGVAGLWVPSFMEIPQLLDQIGT